MLVEHRLISVMIYIFVNDVFHTTAGQNYNSDYLEDDCVSDPWKRVVNLSEPTMQDYGFVHLQREQHGYRNNRKCGLVVRAKQGYQLQVRITQVDIYKPLEAEDRCALDYLAITTNKTLYYCGTGVVSESIHSLTGTVTIQFVSGNWSFTNNRSGFSLYYTSFQYSNEGTCPGDDQFYCGAALDICIPQEVTCDRVDNCGDQADEASSLCGLSTGEIFAVTSFSALGTLVLLIGGLTAYSKYQKRRQPRNRESSIDSRALDSTAGHPNTAVYPGSGIDSIQLFELSSGIPHHPPPPYSSCDYAALPPAYQILYPDVPTSQSGGENFQAQDPHTRQTILTELNSVRQSNDQMQTFPPPTPPPHPTVFVIDVIDNVIGL